MRALVVFVVGVLTATLLTVTSASAAVVTVVVNGHADLAAKGMSVIREGCTSYANAPQPTEITRDGSVLGTSALGWQMPSTGYEVGALGQLDQGETLSLARVSLYSQGASTTGQALVREFDGPDLYLGWSDTLTVPADQWWYFELQGRTFGWDHFHDYGDGNGYVYVDYLGDWTVQDFVDGPAEMGVLMGCNGAPVYMDEIVLTDALNSRTYDLEKDVVPTPTPTPPPPTTTTAALHWAYSDVVYSDPRAYAMYGQRVWLLGDSRFGANQSFTGSGTLWVRRYGKRRFTQVGSAGYDLKNYAPFKVRAARRAVYEFRSAGGPGFLPSTSSRVTLDAFSNVRARVADQSIVQGQRIVVAGTIKPGDKGLGVRLIRLVGKKWVTIGTSRTGRHGRFSVSATAREPGKWKVFVRVMPGKGLRGTFTSDRVVTVAKRRTPAPPPPQQPAPQQQSGSVSNEPAPEVSEVPPDPIRNPTSGRQSGLVAEPSVPGCTDGCGAPASR